MTKVQLTNTATTHGFLEEATSITSLRSFHRIVRKPEERSKSRKSLSNKSSEKSINNIDLSQFYIKINPIKDISNTESQGTKIKNRVFSRLDGDRAQKKRQSTPVPGFRSKQSQKLCFSKRTKDNMIQSDLLVTELQIKLKEERQKSFSLEKRVQNLQKQLRTKLNRIDQLETDLRQSIKRQSQAIAKLQGLQQLAEKSQSNLVQTKNKLEKMKKMIVQTRTSELQMQNAKLRKLNSGLKEQIQCLIQQNKKIQQECKALNNQVLYLQGLNNRSSQQGLLNTNKKQIQNLNNIISQSKTQRQRILEEIIAKKEEQQSQLKLKIDKLEVKINFINRKNSEQMQMFKEKKNIELINIRNKLTLTTKQYYDLKRQMDRLRRKNNVFVNATNEKVRASIMTTNNSWNRDDQIQFYLSPEK